MNETIPEEARIAEHSSAIEQRPDWTHKAARRSDAAEACPPRSAEQRLFPLVLAVRTIVDGMDRADMIGAFWSMALNLLRARLVQLRADIVRLRDLVTAHLQEPQGLTNDGTKAQCRLELGRSLRLQKILLEAISELEESGAQLEGIQVGTVCPTCLRTPLERCRSGWIAQPDDEKRNHPLITECGNRAELNGWAPRVYDRDKRRYVTTEGETL